MGTEKPGALRRLSNVALAVFIALIFVGLTLAIVALPPAASGLLEEVNAGLARTGSRSSVTATLLDFRGYDTLLELAVLLLAVTAIRALGRGDLPRTRPVDEVLTQFSRMLLPFMILVAGYLLMAGLGAAGGAFQAGAILAAAGVLLVLAGRPIPLPVNGLFARLGLVLGLAVFVIVGLACMQTGSAFLDYPELGGTYVLLLVEIGVLVAVALSLLEMFMGVLRGRTESRTTPRAKGNGR